MKSNRELGYEKLVDVGEYQVGVRGEIYRAYGYEWHSEQDASQEFGHHRVCGRGSTPQEAVRAMIQAAIRAGAAGTERGCSGLTEAEALRLQDELLEALEEMAEEAEN